MKVHARFVPGREGSKVNATSITQAFATALILAGAAIAVVSLVTHGTDAARHDVITVALSLISGGFGVFVGHVTGQQPAATVIPPPPAAPEKE